MTQPRIPLPFGAVTERGIDGLSIYPSDHAALERRLIALTGLHSASD
jgi:hypothetical protein